MYAVVYIVVPRGNRERCNTSPRTFQRRSLACRRTFSRRLHRHTHSREWQDIRYGSKCRSRQAFRSSAPRLSQHCERSHGAGTGSERYFSMFCICVPDMREFAENDGSDAKCRLSLRPRCLGREAKVCAAMRGDNDYQAVHTPTVIFLNNSFIISSVKT